MSTLEKLVKCAMRVSKRCRYILFECAGDSFDNLVPVLARLGHCDFFAKASIPLTVLHDECVAAFSKKARSTSSPVKGADRVLSCTIFNGS